MERVGDIVSRITKRLVDDEPLHENVTWSESLILNALNFALQLLATASPELFGRRVFLPIPESGFVTPECSEIRPPFYLVDSNNSIVKELFDSLPSPRAKALPLCVEKNTPSYMIKLSNREYEVYPKPHNPSNKYKLSALCVDVDRVESVDSMVHLPNRWVPVLEELILYYCLKMDGESSTANSRADRHYEVAMSLLGVGLQSTINLGLVRGTKNAT